MSMERLVLHEYARSGNCYKIRLTAAHVGAALERREYDIMRGETRTPAFLAQINANGRIPVLQVGDRFLPESNAACWYLASGTPLVPEDRFAQADVLRWTFWEQYNHEPTSPRCASGSAGSARRTSTHSSAPPCRSSARPASPRSG